LSSRRALVTGAAGQDGSYLAELLLGEGYDVIGVVRDPDGAHESLAGVRDRLELVEVDLLDQNALAATLQAHRPTEVYNLAAQSFVQTSWAQPVFTGETTALGVTRVLDAIRIGGARERNLAAKHLKRLLHRGATAA